MNPSEPRRFFSQPDLPGAGMPHDRMSRLAARHAFVELKHVFLSAVDTVPGERGEWIRSQVRHAEEPIDLWLLRAPVMETLAARDEAARHWRRELRKGIEALFPTSELASGFGSLARI